MLCYLGICLDHGNAAWYARLTVTGISYHTVSEANFKKNFSMFYLIITLPQ